MSRVVLGRTLLASVAAGVYCAGVATAEPLVQPFRLDYAETGRCSAREDFLLQLRRRTQRLRPAQRGEGALVLVVRLWGGPGPVHGQVVLQDPDGTSTVRRITGASCAEVVAALALATAVMVDPDALASPAAQSGGASRAKPPGTMPVRVTPAESDLVRVGLLGGGSVQTGVGPEPLLGWSGEVELLAATEWLPHAAFAFGVIHGTSDQLEAYGGRADFVWTTARLAGCPTRWPASSPAGFRPCMSLDLGALEGSGWNVRNPSSRTVAWFAPGVIIRWELLIGSWLAVVADGGVVLPLIQPRFYFGPSADEFSVYRVPAAALAAGVRAGLRFP